MTREQIAAMLARVKEASDSRWTLVRVIVDEKGQALRTIVRGTFVRKDAGPSQR
jgi:hypothetical protein